MSRKSEVRDGFSVTFDARLPTELRVLPFIILLPSMVAILVELVWWVIALVVGLLAVLVWATVAARITVRVSADTVDIAVPFYRRSIPVTEIAEIRLHRESAGDHGLLNWPVAGLASSSAGVRISLGGTLGPRITTTTGDTYTVFLSTTAEAEACVAAVEKLMAATGPHDSGS